MDRALVFVVVACTDRDLRARLGAALREAGYAVLKADTPDEVLRLASAPARLVVLEGELVKVARHLHEEPHLRGVPVLTIDAPAPPLAELLRRSRGLIGPAPAALPKPALGLLRELINGLTAHVAILDGRGVIVAVNETWRAFALRNGGDPNRLSEGADYPAVCDAACGDEAEVAAFASGLRRVLAGEANEFSHEYPCHSTEELRWFVARVRRVAVAGGSYYLVAHENVTDRKRVEEALERSGQRVRDILESLADGFVAIDPAGAVIYQNSSAERFLGRPRASLLGRNLWEAVPDLAGLREEMGRARPGLPPILAERFLPRAGRFVELCGSAASEGLLLQLRDVTERARRRDEESRAHEERVANLEREVHHLQHLVALPRGDGESSRLRETAAELFAEWAAYYEEVLELALEQRAYRVVNQTSERLRSLAERLAFAGAGPRDVVELHARALLGRSRGANPSRARTYQEEGRLLLLELMGDLMSCYRALARPKPGS